MNRNVVQGAQELGFRVQASGFSGSSGSEAGSYVRLMELVYHSTLGLRVIREGIRRRRRRGFMV